MRAREHSILPPGPDKRMMQARKVRPLASLRSSRRWGRRGLCR
jgi:hypothetical protein